MQVLLDLHYSDSWADKDHQTVPARWVDQDLPTLAGTVRSYTRETVATFAAQGTPVDMVQVGNEVTSGMMWPQGQVYRDGHEHWDGFVALLQAGLQGAGEGASGPLRTLVHVDRGADNGGARYFYDHVLGAGIGIDVIALSYYPFWHGPLAALQANMTDLAQRYGKDVLVVETSYPWGLPRGDGVSYVVASAEQLPEAQRFPATPAGQAAYFEALRAVVQQVPESRGLGFLAWEPAWLSGVGWGPGPRNPYANLAMFDPYGVGLPALAAFRHP
jgi:arabinogalactan endo-1,4-beta-galactosidase